MNDTLGGGFCIPGDSADIVIGDVSYCSTNDDGCTNACKADFSVDFINLNVPNDQQLSLDFQFDAAADVRVEFDPFIGGAIGCTLTATANNIRLEALIGFGIDPASGELEIELDDLPGVDINVNVSGCSFVGDVIDFVVGGLGAALEVDFIRDLLTPLISDLVTGLLPDPLGVEGLADVGALVSSVSPGTEAGMEMRIVPGGYVNLLNGGLNLGVITGINSDEDPTTREPELDSEPALCVPPFPAPDFGAAPALLAQSPRSNFKLNPADLFVGVPETGHDVLLGASETMLDQLGHHLVNSGLFCLTIGTELIPQLNLAAIGIVVPSLAELGSETTNDPLKLVTRPSRPVDFTIGDGTETSPSLTLHLKEFNIDFYAFLFERFTRGFTVTLDMDVGINLAFTTDANGNPAVMPMLVGLEASNIGVTVLNSEFVREDVATLEAVFPSLLDLVLPLVTNNLSAFPLPELLGFQLDQLTVERVTTSEDDFLAIGAGLSTGTMMNVLGTQYPSVALLAEELAPREGQPTSARARLVEVRTPSQGQLRAAYSGAAGGVLPEVIVDLDTHDAQGRELEWSWSLNGGMWRDLTRGGRVHLRDGAFTLQGIYELELRARPVGDYKSWDKDTTKLELVIDSVAPRIITSAMERDAETLSVPAWDIVFGHNVEIAFGSPDSIQPDTTWGDGLIPMVQADAMAVNGELKVFARDPQGNQSETKVRISTLPVAQAGGCSASGSEGSGSQSGGAALLLLLAVGVAFLPRRRLGSLGFLLAAGLMSTAPACSCGSSAAAPQCELNEDCAGLCEEGQVGECFEEECRCLDDVPIGRMGQFSAMALAEDGTVWVSGYDSDFGDLVVASTREMGRIAYENWEYVDGVPDGPVAAPGSTRRFGIAAEGEDTGLYTDIAVTAAGAPMVSYFDKESASLKFAAQYGGEWHKHIVDAGDLTNDDASVRVVTGQYSAISLDAAGVPTIAFFANVGSTSAEPATELRLARATSAEPRSASDWTVEVVDSALVPVSELETDVFTIPLGTGLFVDIVRDVNDDPVLTYYDRINGDLKLARVDVENGGFTVDTLDAEGDVGWYPSVVVDDNNVVHVSYVDTFNQDLLYINTETLEIELVDDGYRIVGTTEEGHPLPEFHFVGDDSAIVNTTDGLYIAYQDATTHELLVATKNDAGVWAHTTIAGNEDPFAGAYGFFAQAQYNGSDLTMSSFVVDQAAYDAWVELFKRSIVIE